MSSRSTRFSFPVLLAVLALGVGAVAAGGCSTETASALADSTQGSGGRDNNAPAPTIASPPTDTDAAAKAVPYRGNPLCHMNLDSDCSPDEGSYAVDTGGICEKPTPDAGDAASTIDQTRRGACRITGSGDGGLSPVCTLTMAGGSDGATCDQGADCAPGFDCVTGEKGAKVCRHYCCAGTCKGQLSQNGGGTFCDVQSLADVHQKAPVCLPLKTCKLFGTGECATNESCAVVTESGDTGCVATGDQQAGSSCDTDHCAAQLTCLGQPGLRKCFKLCRVNSSDCGASMVCETSTVFDDPTFGTCQKH